MRYTKQAAEGCARRLAKALDKDFGNCWVKKDGEKIKAKVGCWRLSYNPTYGGAAIEEIYNEGGGITHPMGSSRLKAYEFCRATDFAISAIDIDRKKRK